MTQPRTHADVLAETVEFAGRRVADVGCGAGELVRWLRERGADVVGVECGEIMRGRALEADPDHRDDYVDGVGQDLPLGDDSCDVVIYSYSLHHVPAQDMDAALAEVRRVLRPGGTLYVVEPVAAGPLHEVVKIIDDETEVRSLAQAALDRAVDSGFEAVADFRYTSETRMADAAAFAHVVVGVSPNRAERLAEHRDEFDRRFVEYGRPVDDGWAFEMENHVRVLRRA
ncbi:MAG: methyltransferase domain-containing protein [Acidimicrobiales bacterium]